MYLCLCCFCHPRLRVQLYLAYILYSYYTCTDVPCLYYDNAAHLFLSYMTEISKHWLSYLESYICSDRISNINHSRRADCRSISDVVWWATQYTTRFDRGDPTVTPRALCSLMRSSLRGINARSLAVIGVV